MSEERSDYWWKRFGDIAKSVPEEFGYKDGGKWRHDKSDQWNRQHSRIKASPVVPIEKPGEPSTPAPVDPPPGDLVFSPGQLVFYTHDGKARIVWNKLKQRWIKNLPQTATSYTKYFAFMSDEMIMLWRGVLAAINPLMSFLDFDRQWQGLTRSNAGFTNGNGSETDHFRIECGVFCPGATFRIVDGVVYRKAGVLWTDVYAIDPKTVDDPARYIDRVIADNLYFFPNAAPTDDRVNPFPNFAGKCIVPLFYRGGRMPVRYNRLVPVLKPQNPFVPARPDVTNGII